MQPVISNKHVHVYLIKCLSEMNSYTVFYTGEFHQIEPQAPNVTIFAYNKT